MKRTICAISGICALLAGCEPTLIAEFEDLPVVCCYLDAGETPVLTVSKLIAFRDDAVYSDQDVDALSITITDQTDGTVYTMESAGGGVYECPPLTAEAGHTYALDFTYDGKAVSSSTSVPEFPRDVKFDPTRIGVMVFDDGEEEDDETRADNPMGGIEITWSNDGGDYYIVEGFTTSSTPVREDSSGTAAAKSFKLDYTQSNTATLSQQQFNYLGNYEVSLIRILPEYVVMSQGSSDTSTTLTDIRGNIEGGYGIFTGISRVKQTIYVYEQESPF